MVASAEFIAGLPKAELHLHIEGTLSVEMKRRFAARNELNLGDASFTRIAGARRYEQSIARHSAIQDVPRIVFRGAESHANRAGLLRARTRLFPPVQGQQRRIRRSLVRSAGAYGSRRCFRRGHRGPLHRTEDRGRDLGGRKPAHHVHQQRSLFGKRRQHAGGGAALSSTRLPDLVSTMSKTGIRRSSFRPSTTPPAIKVTGSRHIATST